MMPCVTNDNKEKAKKIAAITQRKSIYKPKYHAFSIDSIVGNNNNNNTTTNNGKSNSDGVVRSDKDIDRHSTTTNTADREEKDDDERDFVDEYESNLKIITRETSSPNTSQTNNNAAIKHHKRDSICTDKDLSSAATRCAKNDILRSYMTAASHHYITSHHNSSSHYPPQHSGSGSVSNSSSSSHHHLIGPPFDIIRSAIDDKINISNNNSSNSSNNNHHHRNSGIAAGIQSALNANQYYCNQMYCRPYDNRFMHNVCHNAFLPTVCDYESLLIKNGQHDMCAASSFSPYRKPKRVRTAFSPGQLLRLEEIFERNRYVVGCERKQLARDLNLSETQIKVWFQNRRTKHKREKHQESGGGGGSGSQQRKMISPAFSSKNALNLNSITGNNNVDMDYIQ